MSREIPADRPLSDDDREYLLQRGQTGTIELIDRAYPPAEEGGQEPLPPYEEWKLADLQTEATARGLAKSGTIAELAERLYKWDEEHPEGAPEPPPAS